MKKQASIDKPVNALDQLSIYALAAEQTLGLKPDKLTLSFLADSEKVTTVRDEKQLDRTCKKISAVIKGIDSGVYKPCPSKRICGYCDYSKICPYFIS